MAERKGAAPHEAAGADSVVLLRDPRRPRFRDGRLVRQGPRADRLPSWRYRRGPVPRPHGARSRARRGARWRPRRAVGLRRRGHALRGHGLPPPELLRAESQRLLHGPRFHRPGVRVRRPRHGTPRRLHRRHAHRRPRRGAPREDGRRLFSHFPRRNAAAGHRADARAERRAELPRVLPSAAERLELRNSADYRSARILAKTESYSLP